ncbi:phosphogluconate dehydrogenase (NADP(+)-dependent, decarboxylating) [Niabella ginsenosidivorans]|uniref:6-phosphogluconate dehydrogenase, decarboxylating n=1 Tax=Niabella ginsenosidivorans TaxID=1176587 RepID=A0A1A9I7Z8_9BACT|nr:NADP-dependent phosphogluconate dehydrogenase [Niabella ginsenosidivorans]ANH82811.1 phosphogluconate dehydrogenase (NADP(+)-dependent, decarboxylating) [Niabella ginsenosidivorans]
MAARFGMVGLGTMGRNLVLNIADHGFEVCGYDRDEQQRKTMEAAAKGKPVTTAASSAELIAKLESPRIIMLLVPAGKIVDAVINELVPQLQKGDILIDGGNSHFTDTDRRYQALQHSGIHFIGMGVSGGEDGARFGPSMMPGGNIESYNLVKDILEAIAAKAEGEPCVAYMGHTAAGHYVKMVHNGIEYAIMQLISEVYGLLKNEGMTNTEFAELFDEWNKGELQSFLVEITSVIFREKDPETGNDLIDMILDKAEQLGTGLWTSQSALELNVLLSVIDIAVSMRYLSSLKEKRVAYAKLYDHQNKKTNVNIEQLKNTCRDALHFAFMMAYGQGLELMKVASAHYHYDTDIKTVVKVWRGGCIIRSALLKDLFEAYEKEPDLSNIIGSAQFVNELKNKRAAVVDFLKTAMDAGMPAAAFAAVLNYFDAYTLAQLPANLIQAQRDLFGAHTYERIDKPGHFHTNWNYTPPEAKQ